MAGYHEAFAITQKGAIAIVCHDGQFMVFSSMAVAAHNLGVVSKLNPDKEYTIRPFRLRLPWSKEQF